MDKELRKRRLVFAGILGIPLLCIAIDAIQSPSTRSQKHIAKAQEVKALTPHDKLRIKLQENQLAVITTISNGIKHKFQFPLEVEIENESSIVANAVIQDTDIGQVMAQGYCIAKNAFNVRSRWFYEATYTIRGNELAVISIDIIETH